MDSKLCKDYCKKKYSGKIRKIVNNQIDNFFEIENSNYKIQYNKYNIGDDVILSNNNFLHGIGKNDGVLNFVAKNGILSKEATGDLGNHAFQFVVGLWKVREEILLKDYIINYSGMVVRYNNINRQIPFIY